MDILLDTQVLLWSISGDTRLSEQGRSVFLDPTNNLYFSMAGYWEIAIKVSIAKQFHQIYACHTRTLQPPEQAAFSSSRSL